MSTANSFLLQKVLSPRMYFCASTFTIPVGDLGTRCGDLRPPLSLAARSLSRIPFSSSGGGLWECTTPPNGTAPRREPGACEPKQCVLGTRSALAVCVRARSKASSQLPTWVRVPRAHCGQRIPRGACRGKLLAYVHHAACALCGGPGCSPPLYQHQPLSKAPSSRTGRCPWHEVGTALIFLLVLITHL